MIDRNMLLLTMHAIVHYEVIACQCGHSLKKIT